MTKEYLPKQVNPFRFADNASRLRGSLLIKDMLRLKTSLADESGEVSASLQFDKKSGIRFLKGQIEAKITLICQRCLQPYVQEIIDDFQLGIVGTEEGVKRLPEDYEPLLVTNEVIVLRDVVEDELILRLPIVPMHNLKDCKVGLSNESRTEEENPFKVIEKFRDNLK
jgi:uncharacterized protein